MMLPTTGAVRYIQISVKFPEARAGANDRAGFIEAPPTGPANMASKSTTEPTAMPASKPFSFPLSETFKIVSIKNKVRTTSSTHD